MLTNCIFRRRSPQRSDAETRTLFEVAHRTTPQRNHSAPSKLNSDDHGRQLARQNTEASHFEPTTSEEWGRPRGNGGAIRPRRGETIWALRWRVPPPPLTGGKHPYPMLQWERADREWLQRADNQNSRTIYRPKCISRITTRAIREDQVKR